MFTGLSPRNTCWSRSIVSTSRCSVISLTVLVFGTETSMPDCNTGAVIMKITSRTSTTSTNGVMLMSASEERVCPLLVVKATFNLFANADYVAQRRGGLAIFTCKGHVEPLRLLPMQNCAARQVQPSAPESPPASSATRGKSRPSPKPAPEYAP